MLNVHEIIDGMPAPRDDEPLSLRQDIVDEILDHLQSALRRELLVRGGDEISAREHVLQKFGDPRRVARKLWFQAMWSKIMTQRLLVGAALFSTVVSVALMGMVGWMVHGQQQANAALVEQISKLIVQKSEVPPQRDLRWNSLKVRVTLETKDGPAGQGFQVEVGKLAGIGGTDTERPIGKQFQAETDATGLVDCGYVEPGQYEVGVSTPWGESLNSTITVHPGRDHVEHVVAPSKMPESAEIFVNLDELPEDLDAKMFALVISFKAMGYRDFAGQPWWSSGQTSNCGEDAPYLMVVPQYGVWTTEVKLVERHDRWRAAIFRPGQDGSARWEQSKSPYHIRLPASEYSVCFDFLRVPSNYSPEDVNWKKNVLYDSADTIIEWREGRQPFGTSDPNLIKLTARSVQDNNWTIVIPQPILKAWKQRPDVQAETSIPLDATSTGDRTFPPSASRVANRGGGPGGRGGRGRSGFSRWATAASLISELRMNETLSTKLNLTESQIPRLNEVDNGLRNVFRELLAFGPPGSDEFQKRATERKQRFKELDDRVLDLLTDEQKAIWAGRLKELQEEQFAQERERLVLVEPERTLVVELRQTDLARKMNLTEDQQQRLKELDVKREAFIRDSFAEVYVFSANEQTQKWREKVHEFDNQFSECLTLEQKAVWEQRKSEWSK